MGLSNTLKAALLDAYFGDGGLTVPGTLYIGLSSTDPGNDGSGATEPSSNGYARVAIDNTDGGDGTSWNAATVLATNVKDNSVELTFPESTGPWLSGVSMPYATIYDASSGGNFVVAIPVDTARTVDASGITLKFSAGDLNIELS